MKSSCKLGPALAEVRLHSSHGDWVLPCLMLTVSPGTICGFTKPLKTFAFTPNIWKGNNFMLPTVKVQGGWEEWGGPPLIATVGLSPWVSFRFAYVQFIRRWPQVHKEEDRCAIRQEEGHHQGGWNCQGWDSACLVPAEVCDAAAGPVELPPETGKVGTYTSSFQEPSKAVSRPSRI